MLLEGQLPKYLLMKPTASVKVILLFLKGSILCKISPIWT
jgi:hypothetical protein